MQAEYVSLIELLWRGRPIYVTSVMWRSLLAHSTFTQVVRFRRVPGSNLSRICIN